MIITIAGEAGSGKSTVAKLLAKELGYEHRSTGDIWRQIATEQGITLDELNAEVKRNPHRDVEFDDAIRQLGRTLDNFVMDSWLAWNFIPHSVKVYLTSNRDVTAARIYANQRSMEQKQTSIVGVKQMVEERYAGLRERFNDVYDVDITDKSNYDIVIDTTPLDPKGVVDAIKKQLPRT